jgi:hypothetical protein
MNLTLVNYLLIIIINKKFQTRQESIISVSFLNDNYRYAKKIQKLNKLTPRLKECYLNFDLL